MINSEEKALKQIEDLILCIEDNNINLVKEKLSNNILNNMYEDHWCKLVYRTLEWNRNRSTNLVENRINRNKKFIEAVKNQDIKTIKKMIKAKNIDLSYINYEDEDGIYRTAIKYVSLDNSMSFEIIKILTENDKHCKSLSDVLIDAAISGKTEIAKYLLDNDADIDYSTYEGTSLFYAIQNDDIEMVKLLLQYNPRLDITGDCSRTTPYEASLYKEDMIIYNLLDEYSKK